MSFIGGGVRAGGESGSVPCRALESAGTCGAGKVAIRRHETTKCPYGLEWRPIQAIEALRHARSARNPCRRPPYGLSRGGGGVRPRHARPGRGAFLTQIDRVVWREMDTGAVCEPVYWPILYVRWLLRPLRLLGLCTPYFIRSRVHFAHVSKAPLGGARSCHVGGGAWGASTTPPPGCRRRTGWGGVGRQYRAAAGLPPPDGFRH